MNWVRLGIVFLFAMLSSCGGGGGSGGGDGRNDRDGVRLIHGAIEESPFDLFLAGELEALARTVFSGRSFYRSVPEGDLQLDLVTANRPSSVRRSIALSASSGVRYTIFIVGEDSGFSARVLTDEPGEIPEGEGAVRFLHGTDGASALRFEVAGIAGGTVVSYGEGSSYRTLPAGEYQFTVFRQADSRALGGGNFLLEPGSAMSLLFAGDTRLFVTAQTFSDR